MTGDTRLIDNRIHEAARQLSQLLLPSITEKRGVFAIAIAGEPGSGKSELAVILSQYLSREGVMNLILQQDDYFYYPPQTNAALRRKDISRIGLAEVNLALLDENLHDIVEGKGEIEKPLILFQADRITEERITLDGVRVVIVEGTYTTTLHNVHKRVFIERTYHDTRDARWKRAREEKDEFLERILRIEHEIISTHKSRADIVVTRDYQVRPTSAGAEA